MVSDGALEWIKDDANLGQKVVSKTSIDFGNDSGSESDDCLSGYESNDKDGLIGNDSYDENPVAKMAKAVKKECL